MKEKLEAIKAEALAKIDSAKDLDSLNDIKVAVLGNMGELGDTAEALHAEVGTYAAEKNVDLVCGIGDLTRSLVEEASKGANTEALWFADNESFIQAIPDIIKDGDNVLVKASHGMNFPQIVHALEEL